MRDRVRMAAMVLLWVWVGPVTFVQTDAWLPLRWLGAPERAGATASVIGAGEAVKLQAGTPVKVRLRDGDVIEGRYLGRALLDSAHYAQRFDARTGSSPVAPLVLGETLQVTMKDGRSWRAPFAGYGQLTLLLRAPDGSQPRRVPFEFAKEIRRADGQAVEPQDLAKAFRDGLLPSAEALVVEQGLPIGTAAERLAASLYVPAEDVATVTAELPNGGSATGEIALGVAVLSLIIVIALVASLFNAANEASTSCQRIGTHSRTSSGFELTSRPFDLERGCFVGDPLAVADPWPGAMDSGAATAMAAPAAASLTTD